MSIDLSPADRRTDIALAYVGNVVPDQPAFRGGNFSRAANMWQENLLEVLKDLGLPSLILSQLPIRSFPNSRTIWSAPSRATLPSGLEVHFVPFLNLSVFRPLTVGVSVLLNLIRWGWRYRGAQYRVVYTHNITEPPGLFTLIGARLIGAKAIASVNDVNVPGETVPNRFFWRVDFWLHKRLLQRFDGLVVVNKNISQDFAPRVPCVRISGGVRKEVLQRSPGVSTALRQADTPFTIVSTGTLSKTNGIEEILEAFRLLPGDGYRLRIAGVGPLEDMVRQAAKVDPRIEYLGYLTFDEVLALYDTADVLINMRLTQRLHTDYFFPSKLIEYLASGVPVITTCTGHVEEEYSDIAFLLKEETPEALAQMIEQVAAMDPELRMQKGLAAQAYIRMHNTWQAQGLRVAKFIYQVLHV